MHESFIKPIVNKYNQLHLFAEKNYTVQVCVARNDSMKYISRANNSLCGFYCRCFINDFIQLNECGNQQHDTNNPVQYILVVA